MLNIRLYVVLLVLLSACSAAGPKFHDTRFAIQQVPEDKARIVFLRGSDVDFRSATVAVDGTIIGALDQRGFLVADVEPGDHGISAWVRYVPFGEYAVTMTTKAGEAHYIKVSQRFEHITYPLLGPLGTTLFFLDSKGGFKLETVAASRALKELTELKLSE
jgi:Protein of unknown function (DUF2846)